MDFKINLQLLPMKIHYFMFFAAISTVLPYLPLMAKQLGINATATGLIYTIVPFTSTLVSPIFGWLADRLKKLKFIILLLIIIQAPGYFLINYIPAKDTEIREFVFLCTNVEIHAFPENFTVHSGVECFKECQCSSPFNNTPKSYKCLNGSSYFHRNSCISGTNITCSCHVESAESIYETKRFWLFLLLMILSLVMTNVHISLCDAACYESLKGKLYQYGKQRIWGTISYGLGAVLTGYLVDLFNVSNSEYTDYSCCFFLMFGLMIFDFVALTQTVLKKSPSSDNIVKNVGLLFKNLKTVFFVFAVFLVGCLSAIQWNYTFWFLKDLGAGNLLMGLTVMIQCLLAELPCLFYSGWIIKRIGEDNSMCLTFVAFSIWFVSLSFLYNPWFIILVELTQGPSFGLFYATMTSYAKRNAPIGTEATLQTVLGSAFHGLGIGVGSCFGGFSFDYYGGRKTFLFVGCFSAAFTLAYKTGTWILAKRQNELPPEAKQNDRDEISIVYI